MFLGCCILFPISALGKADDLQAIVQATRLT